MPDSLSDLFHRGERLSERAPVFEATVASGAGGLNGTVTVTIDAFDGGQQRWPVDGWNPRGDTYPKRGDRCLVTMSDANRLWLLQWAPRTAGGGPGSSGRGPGGRATQETPKPAAGTTPGVHVGTPRDIIDFVVAPIGTANGMTTMAGTTLTSENISAVNDNHDTMTLSGNISDHDGPGNVRWAVDLSNNIGASSATSADNTPEMDACAEALAIEFGMDWSGSGLVNRTAEGYRYQMIHNSLIGGNHYNHVHFGVRTA